MNTPKQSDAGQKPGWAWSAKRADGTPGFFWTEKSADTPDADAFRRHVATHFSGLDLSGFRCEERPGPPPYGIVAAKAGSKRTP